MDGVVNVVPVPKDVPPLAAANQESVPLDVAPKLTVPVPHLLPGAVPEIVGAALTVRVKLTGVPTQLFKVGVTEIVAEPVPEVVKD